MSLFQNTGKILDSKTSLYFVVGNINALHSVECSGGISSVGFKVLSGLLSTVTIY